MSALSVAAIVFACAAGGVILGFCLQKVLPEAHLSPESKDIIKLGTGLVATMAALVLGLLIGAAKSSFDAERDGLAKLATDVVLLDRTLAHYGAETADARKKLANVVSHMLEALWPRERTARKSLADDNITADGGALITSIQRLPIRDSWHQGAHAHALQISSDLARQRWELSQTNADSLPTAFLVVLAFWLMVLFTSFGLFSPRNTTVTVVLLVCAISVAGAVLLIVDLDQPFDGLIQLSDLPLREAQSHLGK